VQRFIKRTRWRRKKSEFNVEIQDDFTFIEDNGRSFDDTEREIIWTIESGDNSENRGDHRHGANSIRPFRSPGTEEPGKGRFKILDKRRLIGLANALKEGDPDWEQKADDWLHDTKEAYHESFDLLEKKWIEWRLKRRRSTPREFGTIEFLCNDPGGTKWKLFGKRCTAPYRPEILWTEIQSWLKDCNREELEYWRIWDEDGPVDPGGLKYPRDGERFVILLQPKSGTEDIETKMDPRDPESSVQRFIKRTRWRRKKSEFEVGIQDDFTFIGDGRATIDDTEREIIRAIESGDDSGDRRNCGQGADSVRTIGSTGTEGPREDTEIIAKIGEHAAPIKSERLLEHRPTSHVEETQGETLGDRRILVGIGEREPDQHHRRIPEAVKDLTSYVDAESELPRSNSGCVGREDSGIAE
jgi:hypothetical protein